MNTVKDISVGKRSKRSYFDWRHDGETTSGFGFVQPTLSRFLYKDTSVNLQTKCFARLAPLPCPTFGRIEVKQHTSFVPMKEVYPAFDFQQSNKEVQSLVESYIPQYLDNFTGKEMFNFLMAMFHDSANYLATGEQYSGYKPGLSDVSFPDLSKVPFRIGVWVNDYEVFGTYPVDFGFSHRGFTNLLNDPTFIGNNRECSTKTLTAISFINNLFKLVYNSSTETKQNNLLKGCNVFSNLENYSLFSTIDGSQELNDWVPDIRLFMARNPQRNYFTDVNTGDNNWYYQTLTDDMVAYNRMNMILNTYSWYQQMFPAMSVENADFVLHIDPSMLANMDGNFTRYYYDSDDDETTTTSVAFSSLQSVCYLTFHLTDYGKKLIGKIFNPLGIYFANGQKKYELPQLLALYKSWYDKYNPGRDSQWKDTNAYRLIHSYYDSPVRSVDRFNNLDSGEFMEDNANQRVRSAWYGFLYDLRDMYYSLPLDNITVATQDTTTPNSQPSDNSGNVTLYNSDTNRTTLVRSPSLPSGVLSGNLTGLSVVALQRAYYLQGKDSVIGKKIEDYCRVHNISLRLPDVHVLGDSSFLCNISDVIGTVNNESTALGEYAGKGIGYSDGEKMHYEANDPGYLIQTVCVVPLGGYVQGCHPQRISRYDFYQQEYDSLGMEIMPYSEVLGRSYMLNNLDTNEKSFGFVPRYFREKCIMNTSAGDFSLRGSQAQFLPYTLNRLFGTEDISYYGLNHAIYKSPDDIQLYANEELRFIGKSESFGNYNRIFYDTTGNTDNFILHFVHDLDAYAPMKAISDSFDTFDDEIDDSSVKIEHA